MTLPEADGSEATRAAVLAVRGGDRDAFGTLVRLHQDRLFAFVHAVMRDATEAEDVTQEAFARAYRHLDRYDLGRPFYPWLATIAVRLARSWARRANTPGRSPERATSEGGPEPVAGDALEALVADERSRALWKAVEALPSGERTVVHLYYRDQLRVTEIARTLAVTGGTVKTLLFRARRRLRGVLLEEVR